MASLVEFIGVLAFIGCAIGFQIKQPRLALLVLCAPCILWALHFGLLGQWSGVGISMIALIRNGSAAKLDDEAKMRTITLLCLAACFVISVLTYEGMKDIMPFLATLSYTYGALIRHKPFSFRLCCMAGETSWIVYGVLIGSLSCTLASICLLTSIFISICRHDLIRKLPQKDMLKQNLAQESA